MVIWCDYDFLTPRRTIFRKRPRSGWRMKLKRYCESIVAFCEIQLVRYWKKPNQIVESLS